MVASLIVVTALNATPPGDAALYGRLRRKEGAQKRCFAAAVGADDSHLIPPLDIEFRTGKKDAFPLSAANRNGKPLNIQHILDRLGLKLQTDLWGLQAAVGLFNGLQPFQHLLAGLCHLGGGSTHQITGHIVLQLGALRLLLLVQLLLAGILLLPLASVGGVVALVFPQGTVLQLPYFVAEFIKEVAVV